MKYMLLTLTKYADFKGRARRAEYWQFFLITGIANIILGVFEAATEGTSLAIIATLSSLAFNLGVLIPSISVAVRRMHDSNRSGWWILLPIVNIIFLLINGTKASNRFGSDPKAA
jgi:uncharacterized membrane protein YhaH (DUF805 family)